MRSLAIDKSLEGIAGNPLAVITNSGSVELNNILSTYEGRTFYTVINVINTTQNYGSMLRLGLSDSNQFMVQNGPSGSSAILGRLDIPGGVVNFDYIKNSTSRVPGNKLIIWGSINNGLTSVSGGCNNSVGGTYACNPGTGFTANTKFSSSTSSSFNSIFSVCYRGYHNLNIRQNVIKWISTRYSVYNAI